MQAAARAHRARAQHRAEGGFVTLGQLMQELRVRLATEQMTRAEIVDELKLAYMDSCRAEMERLGWRLAREYYSPRDRCFIQCAARGIGPFLGL